MADTDRSFVSQYSTQDTGITVLVGAVPTDADGAVTVTVTDEDSQAILFDLRPATRVATGQYQITLTPDDTARLGNYTATWSYVLGGAQRTFSAFYYIGGAEPAYDALSDPYKAIVDSVWIRMADLFDSPSGGPNLMTWAQTNFTRGRVAQLMRIAMGRLNTMAQPYSTFSLNDGRFPVANWGPLLEQLTWIETIKHLRRSYLEQPQVDGGGISRLDRQSYFDRWSAVLQDEEANVRTQLDIFKMSQMNLSSPAILIAGGIFGRQSYYNRPFMAARPRMWFANVWTLLVLLSVSWAIVHVSTTSSGTSTNGSSSTVQTTAGHGLDLVPLRATGRSASLGSPNISSHTVRPTSWRMVTCPPDWHSIMSVTTVTPHAPVA